MLYCISCRSTCDQGSPCNSSSPSPSPPPPKTQSNRNNGLEPLRDAPARRLCGKEPSRMGTFSRLLCILSAAHTLPFTSLAFTPHSPRSVSFPLCSPFTSSPPQFLRIGVLAGGIAYASTMQGVYESMYSEEAAHNEHVKRKAGGLGVPTSPWPSPESK